MSFTVFRNPRFSRLAAQMFNTLLLTHTPGYQRLKAGEEPGELGELRTKLLKFLNTSQHYDAAECICSFPRDGTCVCVCVCNISRAM